MAVVTGYMELITERMPVACLQRLQAQGGGRAEPSRAVWCAGLSGPQRHPAQRAVFQPPTDIQSQHPAATVPVACSPPGAGDAGPAGPVQTRRRVLLLNSHLAKAGRGCGNC